MRTDYIILAWTGWIWFAIAGTYLYRKLREKKEQTDNHDKPA